MNKANRAIMPLPSTFSEDMVLSHHFLETADRIKDFSFVKWLASLDIDTLNMLESYAEKARNEDTDLEDEDNSCIGTDIILLISLVIAKEGGINCRVYENFYDSLSAERISDVSGRFVTCIICESLRRKGLLLFKKEGTLSDGDTEVMPTELAMSIKNGEFLDNLESN